MALATGVQSLQNARPMAVLPAAPLWDAAPVAMASAGAQVAGIQFSYVPGAAGGAFDFQVQTSIYSVAALVPAGVGVQEWATMGLYAAGAVAANLDSQSREQRELITYGATGIVAEGFIYGPIRLGGIIERVRVLARESGVPGMPGNLQVEIQLQ